jgi:hypothetical protein
MISSANDVLRELRKGFIINDDECTLQEQDDERLLDAEIVIHDVVIQIGWPNGEPEFGLTVEPQNMKRGFSAFQHIGYFKSLEALIEAASTFLSRRSSEDPMQNVNWKDLVSNYARDKGEFTLQEMYRDLGDHPKSVRNPHFRDKLRQVAREDKSLTAVARGRYRLKTLEH